MARLALEEKGAAYHRQTVDIMETAEQFEPWYTALNPKAVVPTLRIGEEIVTDTIRIVKRIDRDLDGPPLTPPDPGVTSAMNAMLAGIMGLHYGVLLYSRRLEADGTAPTIVARGALLRDLRARYPQSADLLDARIAGNARLQAILAAPSETAKYIEAGRVLTVRIGAALGPHDFVCGDAYTLADAFATAALARFRLHEFAQWWEEGANDTVAAYYDRMKARPSFAAADVLDTGSERDF